MYRSLLALIPLALVTILLSLVEAADFDAWVTPNSSIDANSTNLQFNLTINNTNQTLNITYVNFTIPAGFTFIEGSNKTSANDTLFQNGTSLLGWQNTTTEGFIANLTQGWLSFNVSLNLTQGDYNITVNVVHEDSSANEANITVSIIECNSSLIPIILYPIGEVAVWGEHLEVMGYIMDACGNPVENVTVNWTFASGTNNWTLEQNQSNQSLGSYNFTWNETERPPGWFNLTMNVSKTGYPDNQTLQEDSFHISMPPNILNTGLIRTGTCPDTIDFWAQITDAELDYNNITLDIRSWNETTEEWNNWTLLNYTWQDQLMSETITFTHNLTNTSLERGLYSFMFRSKDEFNLTDSMSGTENFTIFNCSRVINIIPVPPTPANGSYQYSSVIATNFTFTSPYYDLTGCTLVYNNGSETNFTANASQGWCSFNISDQQQGLFNFSLWVGNTYTNDSWNGTWYVGVLCIEDWSYGSWGECSNGFQYRSATDLNSCGTTDNRSATSRSCEDDGGGGGGGSETHPRATKVWRNIHPGIPAVMELTVSGIAATSLTIEVSEPVRTSNVVVNGFSSKPSEVSKPPPGRVHSYLNITTTINHSRISRALVEFSVERSWVEENNIDIRKVRLMRLEGNWTSIPTIYLESDDDCHRFKSELPGFSWFAITGSDISGTVDNVTEEVPQYPGQEPETGQEPELEETWDLCTPGESQCVAGLIRQVCNKWGTGWVNKETCYYGCRDGGCSSTLVIEIDYNQLWLAVAGIIIFVALVIIYMKRRAIDDFLFWRL
jgi:PGF-pre-PGF domain-containing protein